MANIEETWSKIIGQTNWKEAVAQWHAGEMYSGESLYATLLEKDANLAKQALETVLEHMVESEMLYNFPEYANVMLEAGIDKSRLTEVAIQAVDYAIGEEDCDLVRDVTEFIQNSLGDENLAEDLRTNAKENCCSDDEYDWE